MHLQCKIFPMQGAQHLLGDLVVALRPFEKGQEALENSGLELNPRLTRSRLVNSLTPSMAGWSWHNRLIMRTASRPCAVASTPPIDACFR